MLDLKKLLEGAVPSVEFSLSLDDCEFIDDTVSGTSKATGVITNHSGVIALNGELIPDLNVTCARCGKEFKYSSPISLNAKIADKLDNEDDEEFILLVDHQLDIDEVVRTCLLLELPSRFLCKEDCKGLCSVCGCDLNEKTCSCNTKERDPRWDVLKDFFGE